MEAFQDIGKWILEGKIKYKNDIVPGLENASGAIKKLFSGENQGKLIVKVSEEKL
jgi:NADPH-dependent curcumin reductase CurA